MTERILITLSNDIELAVEDVWPDGDAPENPTAADVARVMQDSGSKAHVLRDWCLLDGLDVWVDLGKTHAEAWGLASAPSQSPSPGGES